MLPGGVILGEYLYFTGENQIVGRRLPRPDFELELDILVRGSRGEVVGLGLEPDSLAMRFSNEARARHEVVLDDERRLADPAEEELDALGGRSRGLGGRSRRRRGRRRRFADGLGGCRGAATIGCSRGRPRCSHKNTTTDPRRTTSLFTARVGK